MNKPRGRPKLYDAKKALKAAGQVFWTKGFSDTSLDDLATAMAMNRPSIYRAFGDKEAIYQLTLAQFREQMEQGFTHTMHHCTDISEGVRAFYQTALAVYFSKERGIGCMVMCTAPSAALVHPKVQADLLAIIEQLDVQIMHCLEKAATQHRHLQGKPLDVLAKLIQCVLHSLAIRARAGESKASLLKFIDAVVPLMFDV